jgi:hypothetical protein
MFGRRATTPEVTAEVVDATKPQGKGRPTPKRRDAEAARKAKVVPPKDKKQAKERLRSENKRERDEQLAGLRAGDERLYPLRDRGKARKIARNVVDGRRGAGEFFWPVVIGALIFLLLPVPPIQRSATWLLLGYYVIIVTDTAVMLLGLNRLLKRAAADDPARKGTLPYAFGRSLQSRKRRLPVSKVSVGFTRKALKGQVDPLGD